MRDEKRVSPDAWETFQREAAKPNASESLIASLRAALEAHDPALVPAIASLGREYATAGKRPDRFFRGCARMLMDMDGDDLAALCMVFVATRDLERDAPDATGIRIVTLVKPPSLRIEASGAVVTAKVQCRTGPLDAPERIVQFIGTNHLGLERAAHGGISVEMTANVFHHLRRVVTDSE